ncbi:MAG: hypothetical protein C0624_07485 [Desulfuromonas sp.]|nr:MAG: hypothetical protein C0624_07485 [Desulfuromonas sp.]
MRRAVMNKVKTTAIGLLTALVVTMLVGSAAVAADDEGNRLKAVEISTDQQGAAVTIAAQRPIGYRYTVYDSQDPRRIVVDFRGMDVSAVTSPILSEAAPVSEVRVSSFDLTSGKLGRVEILLTAEGDYNVVLDESKLNITVAAPDGAATVADTPSTKSEEAQAAVVTEPAVVVETPEPVVDPEPIAEPAPQVVDATPASGPAKQIASVSVEDERVVLGADGDVDVFKYFTLTGPTRLVVDVYSVKAGFKKNAFALANGFKKMRVGVYKDKIRFVLDSSAKKLPDFGVNKEGDAVIIAWGGRKDDLSTPLAQPAAGPVAVEALDFYQQDATSIFSATVSDNYVSIKPTTDGNIIRFGVQNATIGRDLRRVFDSSAFPSSVRMVTPYTVQRPYGQDVMFAVELKGPVDYELDSQDKALRFVAQNESFNEMAPASVELREVETELEATTPLTSSKVDSEIVEAMSAAAAEEFVPASEIAAMAAEPEFVGQKITLVFDDADIRDILQLIADVSNMNIVAGDDVKGKLTIRLVDVPWDQALAIVLDIKGLGKVESGNVVRIMPKEKIRDDETVELDIVEARRLRAPLETRIVEVSYTDVGTIATQITPMLTPDRGKVTKDLRNKQLIVTDISDVLDEVEKLVSILDTPERQVMIEARIVEANTTFSRDIGVNWGVTKDTANPSEGDLSSVSAGGGGGFLISPPAVGAVGSNGFASEFLFGRLGIDNTILDLRLSALESTGNGKVVSTPRVTTLNGKQALIEQGTEIPYQSVDSKGNPKTEFKDVKIRLRVTPQINPDESIILEIDASNDTVGNTIGSVISLNTKNAQTTVLVKDSETTVIGGVYIETENESDSGVPILMHIPILGNLFKSKSQSGERRELLIFITPRIVKI